ncbi:MAG: rod shape-determining protein RodA [Bacteroidales bacterium]|nr:rod shape-determining protein RodA [Bacteroidales bacterium]MDY2878929.1 rod shape-determining protein RodA [Candidatus Cryptobacteroides sp.]
MNQANRLDRGLKQTVDWRLVGIYIALVFIGWINIYASVHSSEPSSIFDLSCRSGKQFIWMITAFIIAAVILFALNPHYWEVSALPLYLVVTALLVLVIFVSKDVKGSHSWFELGPVKFQPAELSKISTSLLLATVLSKMNRPLNRFVDVLRIAPIILLPMLIIVAESETGSALVYVGFIFVLYREGLSGWYLTLIGAAIVVFILTLVSNWWISIIVCTSVAAAFLIWTFIHYRKRSKTGRRVWIRNIILSYIGAIALVFATDFLFHNVLQDHQRSRIEVLLGLKDDPSGVGYNVRQSMIAIGSGGLTGKGFLGGTQTAYGFVPEQSTDFIFCTVGEEWGFVGCLLVVVLYCLLIGWIIQDADKSRESFTRIYGYCLASCLFMHLFINIGMTIGLMPVIGIPLPLLSYGGSSLWTFTAMLFIFIALNRQENKYF